MNTRPSHELRDSISRHLCEQGIDGQLARAFSRIILDHAVTWQLESSSIPDDCKAILAISFGYRLNPNGNRTPGPVNEALAASVLHHYRRKARPVYAQCEIAELLSDKVPAEDLHRIYPKISGKTGVVRHLGTEEMVAEVAKAVQDPASFSPWLLVAHRHHAARCSTIAGERGFGEMVVPELPDLYDHNSAQPWRKRHLVYLVSEVISRLTMYTMHQLYPAMLRSEAISAPRQDQPDAIQTESTRAEPRSTNTSIRNPSFEEALSSEDIPLRASNEDYAAIPCYVPQKTAPAAASSARPNERRSGGGVTDRTQDDTSHAAAAILKRAGNRVA